MWFIGKLSHDKRGTGSIIGATFIVLILLSGLTFYTLYASTTEHYHETLDSMSEMDWNRNREMLVIKKVEMTDATKLNLTVENKGPILSRIIWLGIFNKTATPETQEYQTLDVGVDPAEVKSIVSDDTITEGMKYVIQLVTELGNTIEHTFYPASEVNCKLTLLTAPPTAYEGNNVTVLLIVTHNDTGVDTIQNLTASLEAEPIGLVEVKEEPISLTVEGLQRGESAFFRWIYNTTNTGTVTFNATYEQAPTSTYVLATVEIASPPSDGAGESQYDFVDDNTSNEDGSDDKGTHDFFSAQQAGPDGIVDTLSEGGTAGENVENDVDRNDSDDDGSIDKGTENDFANAEGTSLDSSCMNVQEANTGGSSSLWLYVNADDETRTQWTRVGANPYLDAIDYNTNYAYESLNNKLVGDFGFTDSGKSTETIDSVTVQLYAKQSLASKNLEVFVWDGSVWTSLGTQTTPTSWDWMNWTATTELNTWAKIDVAEIYIKSRSGGGTYEVDCARLEVDYTTPENYQIDFEYKWTTAAFSSDNEKVCIYVEDHNGSETLNVNYWSGSWTPLGTITSTGWNNFTATGLDSANYTIQLIGASESSDGNQDDWDIDLITLHTWGASSYELDLEVQWTDADYDETNEWLSIYGGTMGSEDILVDVWDGATWNNLFTDLSSGWNSIDVSSYLNSSTFTIRFRSIADAIGADEWEIDAAFLYVWT